MKRIAGVLVVLVVLMGGCVMSSTAVIDSNPQDAELRMDNRVVGTTPMTMKLSNPIWEDPQVQLRAEGYRDMYGGLRKEIKGVNLTYYNSGGNIEQFANAALPAEIGYTSYPYWYASISAQNHGSSGSARNSIPIERMA